MTAPRFLTLLIAGAVCLFCNAGAASGRDQASGLTTALLRNGYRAVSLQHSRDYGFTLAARINGKPARLAVSMASPLSAIFRGADGRLGLREKKSGDYLDSPLGRSKEEYGLAAGNTIELANMVMPTTTFVVLNNSNVRSRDLSGILGEAELYRLAAILDCGNSRLYLRPAGRDPQVSGTIGRTLAARGFTSVPMRITPLHHFEVPYRVNTYQSFITLEPMNSGTTISNRSAGAGRVPVVETTRSLVGVGGVRQLSKNGDVAKLVIGSFVIPNARVDVAEATFDVLGLDLLEKCSAMIDLGAKNLYLHGRPIQAAN
jgi:hypothetical protein